MRSIRQIVEMEFDISYTSKEITPWGGMVFLKQMLQKIGFRKMVDKCDEGIYKPSAIIDYFIIAFFVANKLHIEVTSHDRAFWKYLIGIRHNAIKLSKVSLKAKPYF